MRGRYIQSRHHRRSQQQAQTERKSVIKIEQVND